MQPGAVRLLALLKVNPDEARLALAMALCFALVALGRLMGSSAADALLFRRFGVEYLPPLFIGLGVATFLVSLFYASLLGRMTRQRLFSGLLLSMAALLLAGRALLALEIRALYPILWLSVNLIGALLGTLTWNIAGEVCETRQAKRLFPLFVSAGILGSLAGSVGIGPAARLLGTENLLVLYGLLLLLAVLLVRRIARRHFRTPESRAPPAGWLADIRTGYDYVRRSPLLQRLAVSAVLFSVLYFSVSFPFGRAVASVFRHEAELAGFLGLFNGLTSLVTFVAALLVANRLYARIGVVSALLLLPLTYLLGFVLLTVQFSLASAVFVRLMQLAVMSGIGDGAYSTFFNVVPPEKRAQVRAFDAGVPSQIGTILSGVLLMVGERLSGNVEIFLMGGAVALLCMAVVWGMRRSYAAALVTALRAGRVEVFAPEKQVFAAFHHNAEAIRITTAALRDANPATQQVAAEMLTRMRARAAAPRLMQRLLVAAPEVKVSFIRALAALGVREAAPTIVPLLSHAAPAVRLAALQALPRLYASGDTAWRPLVAARLADADLNVRAQALVSLALDAADEPAIGGLVQALDAAPGQPAELRREALRALHDRRDALRSLPAERAGPITEALVRCLADPAAAVRERICRILHGTAHVAALEALAGRLSDPMDTVRVAAARALAAAGPAGLSHVAALLETSDGELQEAALEALAPAGPAFHAPLRQYARRALGELQAWSTLHAALPRQGRVTGFLAAVLKARAAQQEKRLLQVLGRLGNAETMALVGDGLRGSDTQARAAALEALDVLGDKALVRAFLPLLEHQAGNRQQPSVPPGEDHVALFSPLVAHADRWVRALAVRAIAELDLRALQPTLRTLLLDPDTLVAGAARDSLKQMGEPMETLTTLSLVERVLLLKEVPLFEGLSPDDLGRLAEFVVERWFPDGATLCREGEEGDTLYVVAAGCVRVTKAGAGGQLLARRCRGEFLGEMAIILSAPRSATVTAEGEVRTLEMGSGAFRALLRESPAVSLAILQGLSRRLSECA